MGIGSWGLLSSTVLFHKTRNSHNPTIPEHSLHKMYYSLLADAILIIHLAYACFVLFGFIAVLAGVFYGWSCIKNVRFRTIHLACTVLVPLETLLGMICPLTTLENFFLRASGAQGYNRSFIGNLVSEILFHDAPEWIFIIIYVVLAVAVILCYVFCPPLPLEGKLYKFRQVGKGRYLRMVRK